MEEISLRELIEILIKRRKLIILFTVVAVLLAGILSFFVMSPKYEAKMILITSNISGQIKSIEGEDNGTVSNVLDAISQYPSMNLETYRQQIKTPEVLQKTIEDLNLQEKYSVETLASQITLETVDNTELISIKMQHTDPELAAKIINKVGENFILVVEDSVRERVTKTSKDIEEQMAVEKEKYDTALLEQKELLSKPKNADELQLELNAKLEQVTYYKTELNNLSIRKNALESALEAAEKEPNRTNSLTIRQSSSSSGTMNLILDDTEKALKIDLAEVNASVEAITNKITEMQKDIENLQIELQDKVHEEQLVQQKVDIAKKTYEAFVKKYEELKVAESSKIGESSITIMSKAYPSTKPVAPRKTLNVAIALVLGLMVGVFVAFFQEYWQSTGEEMRIKEENK